MHNLKARFNLFLFAPLGSFLAFDAIYVAFGIFADKLAFFSQGAFVGIFILLNLAFFLIILLLSQRLIRDDLLNAIALFYADMQDFYKNNKVEFTAWAQRIIRSPREINEISRYFHNNIARKFYDLHHKITSDSLTELRTSIILRQDLEYYPNHIIAILNLSNFKEINSFYGVELADKILCAVANILKNYFKDDNYLLYRIHGDDFAILWTNCTDRSIFIKKLENFLDYLSKKEILIDSYTYINLTATVGIAFSYDSAKYSMVNALMALHHAKEYKNPIVIYNRNLPILTILKNNIQYTEIIYHALKYQDVIPFYQQVQGIQAHINDREHKYEALMRIRDKEGHIIPPGLFLGIAKRSSAYSKLSRLMIEKTLMFLATRKDLIFSINLALEDIMSPDFSIWFMDRIVHYGLEGRVIVEITEQESIEDFDSISSFITNIKELGVQVALDDFGSGYSNFSTLMQLPIDYLKIDGSLVKNIDKDENARIVVETIVQFSQKLNIYTIAEFVATKEIFEVVQAIGIDYAQGYFVGKPEQEV